jgi:hypothetical protein
MDSEIASCDERIHVLKKSLDNVTDKLIRSYKIIARLNYQNNSMRKRLMNVKRTAPFFLLILISINGFCQDDLYTTAKKDTIFIGNDIENIQYCLGKYYQHRQTGLLFSLSGAAVLTVAGFAVADESNAKTITAIMGGLLITTGVCYTFYAEKWLKKASIKVAPGGIRINF